MSGLRTHVHDFEAKEYLIYFPIQDIAKDS